MKMKRFTYEIGRALRETGSALDRAGLEAIEKPIFKEPCECGQQPAPPPPAAAHSRVGQPLRPAVGGASPPGRGGGRRERLFTVAAAQSRGTAP